VKPVALAILVTRDLLVTEWSKDSPGADCGRRGFAFVRAQMRANPQELQPFAASYACGPEVTLAGGEFQNIAVDQAYVDGNLFTAPAWPAHSAWLARFLEVLGTKISP
jgi:putative intracellular protease/amidase